MNETHLETKIMVIGMSAFVLIIGILSIKIFTIEFDPIPWLTLIIGGVFGLVITIIISNRSQQVLTFISNAEQERQMSAKRTITNNVNEVKQSVKYYFETINGKTLSTQEKKDLLSTFLPRFKVLVTFSQNQIPVLGNSTIKDKLEKIENYLKLFNDLLLILEYSNEEKFEKNISNLSEYSEKLTKMLNEIQN